MAGTPKDIYTLTEAAKILGYCRETTRQLIQDVPGVYRTSRKAAHYRIPAGSLKIVIERLSAPRSSDQRQQ